MKKEKIWPVILVLIVFTGLSGLFSGCTPGRGKVNALVEKLSDEDPSVRLQAAKELDDFGSGIVLHADVVIPPLIEALGDENDRVRDAAYHAIGSLGLSPKQALIDALKQHENPRVRSKTAIALAGMAIVDKSIIPILVDALADKDSNVRFELQLALGFIIHNKQVYPKETSNELIKALKHDNPLVRAGAADALSWFEGKPEGEVVIGPLKEALKDENLMTCVQAAGSIFFISGDSALVVPILINGLSSDDEEILMMASIYLGGIGPDAKDAIPTLIRLLKSGGEKERSLMIHPLGRIGAKAIPPVLELLEDENPAIRLCAIRVLRWMKEEATDALPSLIKLLEDEDRDVRLKAIETIGRIGPKAQDAVDNLAMFLDDDDKEFREAAQEAIANIKGSDEVTINGENQGD
jgi:HEAT repeat protein